MGASISTLSKTVKGLRSLANLVWSLSADFSALTARAALSPGLPNPNPSRPYWLDDPPFPDLAARQSSQLPPSADVVVIGSGIAGAAITRSLLHELRRRGAGPLPSVTVLEARDICSGATGRNGGHIKHAPVDSFSRLRKTFSPERAAALVRFQARHLECLTGLCKAEGIEAAEARAVETVDFFLDSESFKTAEEELEACAKWLPEVKEETEVWEGQSMREKFGVNDTVSGAMSYPAGAIWPYRFVTSIWKRLLDDFNTLTIETNTPVHAITTSSSTPAFPYLVETSRGVIRARHIVHATNAFAGHLVPGLRSRITGATAHMSAQKPGDSFPPSRGDRSWSIIYEGGFDYVTQRPSPGGDLMLGGGFTRSRKNGADQIGYYDDGAPVDALTATHVMGIFPAIFMPNWGAGAEVRKIWTGIIGFTGDLVPLVGRLNQSVTGRSVPRGGDTHGEDAGNARDVSALQKRDPGEWLAAGFSGEGMVWAWLCGTALGIMLAGSEEEDIPQTPGQPGGKLADWFPPELLISKERLESAHVSNLADQM